VRVGAVATPLLFVETTAVADGPGNAPLAPLPGAVKVTGIAFCGVPDSVTVAFSAVAKAVLMVVLCGVPAVALIA
jgi:hypothetical protein